MTFADWRFQIFKNNKGTLMVLILLEYIFISFCSNFLYAQICRCRDAYSSVINHVLIINYVSSEPRMFTIYNLVQPASQKNWYSISVWLWSCGAMELCLLTFPALLGTSQPASQPARPGSSTDLVQYPQSGLAPNTLQQYSQWSLLSPVFWQCYHQQFLSFVNSLHTYIAVGLFFPWQLKMK